MRNVIFTIALVLLLAPISVFAVNNATLSNGAEITANGVTVTVNGSSHDINSLTVNSGNFKVTLSDDSSLTVRAANKNTFSISPSGTYLVVSETCTSDYNELVLRGTVSSDDDQTLTITPESSTCSSTGGGGSPGGGGGDGGGAAPAPAPSPEPTEPAEPTAVLGAAVGLSVSQAQSILNLLESFNADQNVIDAVRNVFTGKPTAGAPSAAPGVSAVFSRGLGVGVSGADVKRLQKLLNSDPDTRIASSGIGSPGNETDFFGSLTESAVQKFQMKHGVAGPGDPGYGYVGPKTRAKLKGVFGEGVPAADVAEPSPVAAEVSPVFNRTLSPGASGADVKRLQKLLNSDPDTRVASSGIGSPGNETDFFGSLTESAVQKFQAKYGVVSSGSPATTGYGLVGPQTRAKLQEVFGTE